MPSAAARPCRHHGCGILSRDGSGFCQTHKSDVKKASNFTKQLSRHVRGYGSAWEKLRIVILRRDGGLCQVCKAGDRLNPGEIVDHIKPKTEGGTDDPENLQTICKPCHTMKTALESARGGHHVQFEPEWLPQSVVPVIVVCGPPGSGKSTYVQQRAIPDDLVIDVDVIASKLYKLPIYHATFDQRMVAIRFRNKLLASLADKSCGYRKAWLIVTAGREDKRAFWRRKYGDRIVIMATPKMQCIDRVRNDERRPEGAKRRAVEAIYAWS